MTPRVQPGGPTDQCHDAGSIVSTGQASQAARTFSQSQQQAAAPKGVRVARRIVPRTTAVQVTLADGTSVAATILNLSASGVALSLDTRLADGQGISVGRRRATVVRQIPQGVGAAFVAPLDGAFGEDVVL